MLALGEIVGAELPSLRRVLQTSLQPRLLLLLGDMQVEFKDGYVILREVMLEGVYLAIAPRSGRPVLSRTSPIRAFLET
jgi:hypothetical protein